MRTLFICLFLPLISIGQNWYKSDTTCYSYQYIAVPIGEFSPVPSPLRDSIDIREKDSSDFFDLIYQFSRKRVLRLHNYSPSLLLDSIDLEYIDLPNGNYPDDHIIHYRDQPYSVYHYQFLSNHARPTYDYFGFPITDDNRKYINSPNDTLDYFFSNLAELRILERNIDYENNYQAFRIGFVAMDLREDYQELFWIDWEELKYVLFREGINTDDLYWYKIIDQRLYGGFRYKQDSCDDFIRR